MKPPIVAYENGNVLVFDTLQEAENYIEPIDVLNQEYQLFDSEGSILEASVYEQRGYIRTAIKGLATGERNVERLRYALQSFIQSVEDTELNGTDISELILKALHYQ